MPDDMRDIGQWFQRMVAGNTAYQTDTVRRYTEFLQRLGRGEFSSPEATATYQRFLQEETTRYVREVMQLSFNYYSALAAAGQNYNQRFFEQMLGAAPQQQRAAQTVPVTAADSELPRRITIELAAALGADALRSFVLENKHGTTAEISFLVSEFSGPFGVQPFRAALDFQPPRLTLAPGQEQSITLRIPLTPELFQPGQSYRATVLLRGYDELELELLVSVGQPAAAADAAGANG